jgi:hypothetical protein
MDIHPYGTVGIDIVIGRCEKESGKRVRCPVKKTSGKTVMLRHCKEFAIIIGEAYQVWRGAFDKVIEQLLLMLKSRELAPGSVTNEWAAINLRHRLPGNVSLPPKNNARLDLFLSAAQQIINWIKRLNDPRMLWRPHGLLADKPNELLEVSYCINFFMCDRFSA